MEPKITLEQFKELRKIEGEMGAQLDTLSETRDEIIEKIQTFEKSLKIIQLDYKKMSDILEEVRKTTGLTSFD